MKRKKEKFYYIILDYDQKKFNVFKPEENVSGFDVKVAYQKSLGRDLRSYPFKLLEKIQEHIDLLKSEGFSYTDTELVERPVDETNKYKGVLPGYAKNADRLKIFKYHCERCHTGRIFQLPFNHPGKDILRSYKWGTIKAKCLKCGYEINDNYNWW